MASPMKRKRKDSSVTLDEIFEKMSMPSMVVPSWQVDIDDDKENITRSRREIIEDLKKQRRQHELDLEKITSKIKSTEPMTFRSNSQQPTTSQNQQRPIERRKHELDFEKASRTLHRVEQSGTQTLKCGSRTWNVSIDKINKKCPHFFYFCSVNESKEYELTEEKFQLEHTLDGLDGIIQLIVHGKDEFYKWLTNRKQALSALRLAILFQFKNFDSVISSGVNFNLFSDWDSLDGGEDFVKLVEICETFEWYLPTLRYNLCDWLIFHYNYQSTVVKSHNPKLYSMSWLGRLPVSFMREVVSRLTRQFGVENVIFDLLLEWAKKRYAHGNDDMFPLTEATLKVMFSFNNYYQSWKKCQAFQGDYLQHVSVPCIKRVMSTLEKQFKYNSRNASECRLGNSVVTIQDGIVVEFNNFLQRGRIVSSNVITDGRSPMRCATNVDDSILYAVWDQTLYRLKLAEVSNSQSGTCKWTILSKTFAGNPNFSTCDGLSYHRHTKCLFIFHTGQFFGKFLTIYDCTSRKVTKVIDLSKQCCDKWKPDVFCFHEPKQSQIYVGGRIRDGSRTVFYSIDTKTFTISTLPSIAQSLKNGTIIVHPTTNNLFYVGGEVEGVSSNANKTIICYELKRNVTWKVINVQHDGSDGNILTPLCSFPKPYNFLRIHACEFSGGKRFQNQTIELPITSLKDERCLWTSINSNVNCNDWYTKWNPSYFQEMEWKPVVFCGLMDRQETPLRDEPSSDGPTRAHVLMPVKSIAQWWLYCRELRSRHCDCISCEHVKKLKRVT